MSKSRIIAAFDFDKTLTYHDTTLDFLLYSTSYGRAAGKFFFKLPYLIGFPLSLTSRQQVKEELFKSFFLDKTLSEMNALGLSFAQNHLPQCLRPEALAKLRWHQAQGHTCALISASIKTYLEPWCKIIGIDHLICSELEFKQGLVTGKLKGCNCWGPEKTRRLQEIFGPKDQFILYAYGDSQGDKELLELADYPHYRTF